MIVQERVSLAPLTTFHIGGLAHFFAEAHTEEEIAGALERASSEGRTLFPLGAGSNVLVPDAGVEGVVLKVALSDITFLNDGEDMLLIAGAGILWDEVVDAVGARGLFGIENLAGIPGTLGGAVFQNIGAYGAEIQNVFAYADVIDSGGAKKRVTRAEAGFRYRTSVFKEKRGGVITRVALRFVPDTGPNLAYPDLARAYAAHTPLTTPAEIAHAVRAIRKEKFPETGRAEEGTAGSFFKNPVISPQLSRDLTTRFPEVPAFPQENGTVKVSLAWILDHVLALKGHAVGKARLYEKQPLVIVTKSGATATEVEALAQDVEKRVFEATGIRIEREVETFGTAQ
ncbi:MAG: UDP-N-acetylmuramate dehydrogenase [bacterium]|nr:UDP-N-acetylmuramate dehydrogenase [bacterium]